MMSHFSGSLKCLTLHAHWAEAIFALGKDVENRIWSTDYRGPLAIHAGLEIDDWLCTHLHLRASRVKRGAVIGIVDLIDCVRDSRSQWAQPHQFHWLLANPRRCRPILPRAGQRGLYTIDLDVDTLSCDLK